MHRLLLLILLVAALALSARAQQDEAPVTPATEAATEAEAETAAEPEEVAEPAVDDEYYQDIDDKDFRPSEDIPADQSIPFPSDI
jgi:hypothetical protein